MRLALSKLVTLIILLLSLSYLITGIISQYNISEISRASVFLFLLLYYCIRKKNKFSFFGFFLLFYALAETTIFYKFIEFSYYSGLVYYILAHTSLLVYILLQIKFKELIKKFFIQIGILLTLGGYLFYSLESIMTSHFDYGFSLIDFILDSIYNLSFLLVLIFALLNYLQTDTKKNFILFLACSGIVFSELIQIVYFFADQNKILHTVFSILLILGFYFIYFFINLKDDKSVVLE